MLSTDKASCRTGAYTRAAPLLGLVPHSGTELNNARPFPTGGRGAALSDAGVSRGRYLGSVVREYRRVLFMRACACCTRLKKRRFDCRRYGFGLIAVKKYQLFERSEFWCFSAIGTNPGGHQTALTFCFVLVKKK